MYVGIGRIFLFIPLSNSLKARRRVVSSICNKVRSKFNVAVSDVSNIQLKHEVEIGFSVVSNSPIHAQSMLNSILEFIESITDCEIQHFELEVVPADYIFGGLSIQYNLEKSEAQLSLDKGWPVKVDKALKK